MTSSCTVAIKATKPVHRQTDIQRPGKAHRVAALEDYTALGVSQTTFFNDETHTQRLTRRNQYHTHAGADDNLFYGAFSALWLLPLVFTIILQPPDN